MKIQIITILSFFAICISTIACKKCATMQQATITGFDATKCACCGGYIIQLNNETFLAQADLGEKLPMLNTADFIFPLHVNVVFTQEVGNCGGGKRIVVSEVEVR